MAKHSSSKASGVSKFRMVVIDAELQDGEISQLAQAIQGAFGGQRLVPVRVSSSGPKQLPALDSDVASETDGAEVVEDVGSPEAQPESVKPRAPKKIRTPNLDPELHPEKEPSFRVYAEARSVTSSTSVLMKFLTAAAWLSEERSGLKITADRAYTCFRFIGWPFNIDFDQPLRDLSAKRRNLLELKSEDKGKGEFTITHLGLDKATKMKVAS